MNNEANIVDVMEDSESDEENPFIQFTPRWYIREHEELEMWSIRITAQDMVDMYEDPVSTFFNRNNMPESNIYREHSLAGLKDEFRYQNTHQIAGIFRMAGFSFAQARRTLLLRENSRKTRRPDKDVGYPAQTCIGFVRERRFCQLEQEINWEMERRRLNRDLEVLEATAAGRLEECAICLAKDCLPAEIASCQAGHRFCRKCVVTTAEGVLATGMVVVRCLDKCEMEVGDDQLEKVLPTNILYMLGINRQMEGMMSSQRKKLVSCPFCPYQTIMDNTKSLVVKCLNPVCGRESCWQCKLSNHLPLRCKQINVSRRKVEEKLTKSRVRQCWNCKLSFERVYGCNEMTCPKCGRITCYICRKRVIYTDFHIECENLDDISNKELHERELNKTAETIKRGLTERQKEVMEDLFKPGPSTK